MKPILFLIIFLIGFSYLSEVFESSVTVYELRCFSKEDISTCKDKSIYKTKYKVFPEQQIVIGLAGGGYVYKYNNCTVFDQRNWSCSNEKGDIQYQMQDGDLIDLDTLITNDQGKTAISGYQVGVIPYFFQWLRNLF